MDKSEMERLKTMLEANLSSTALETARAIWNPYQGNWNHQIGGLMEFAWIYYATNQVYDSIQANTEQPYMIERKVHNLANKVQKIINDIDGIRPDCYKLFDWSPFALAWHKPGNTPSKVSPKLDSSMFFCFVKQPEALELLAQSLEDIAKCVSRMKIKNEQREQPPTREGFKQGLIYSIGKIVVFRERPISHTLMIAREVHRWARNEPPGSEWGKDSYNAIKDELRQIDWIESAEERKQQIQLSGFPQFRESESSAKKTRGSRR